jgi:hypothetical protein
MAGLYLTIENSSSQRLKAAAARLRFRDEHERSFSGPISYAWLAHDNPEQYAPAVDPASGVHVITAGRLVWPQNDWQRAERLPFAGGLACRLMLDRYLNEGVSGVAPYNGAAAVFVWDPRIHELHLWTDQFGYHPAFLYKRDTKAPTIFTTFPEALRDDPFADSRADEVSMAEFLRAWRATPPHTYFEYLKHAGAATHWTWNLAAGTASSQFYWQPFQGDFFKSTSDAAEALSESLKVAVSERTAAAKKVTLFVSGGADSRVMLFGADDPGKITGINIYETEPTHESNISRALCDRIGARYVGFARDNDYYPRMLAENLRWSGAMWSAEDSHYLGVHHVVDQAMPDLVMTACTTDWVFKGYGLEKTYKMLFGRYLPLLKFLPTRVEGFLPNYPRPAPDAYREAIDHRMSAWFEGCPTELKDDVDYLKVEDRRIRPTSYTVSVSGQMMYRIFPYDTFLADSRVANCYTQIPAWMKLNSSVWGLASRMVCKGASDIVDSNFGWELGSSQSMKLAMFAKGWLQRRLLPRAPQSSQRNDHPPCYASWPDFGWYVSNSDTVRSQWENARVTIAERVTRLWGSDPFRTPLNEWSHSPLDFFRLLTLIEYLRSTIQ